MTLTLKEAGTSNFSVISLAEMYDYFYYFGYTNTRLATLQALVGAEVTGVYYGQELSVVGSILISQGVEYNSWNPKLTQSTLKELKDWYDSCNKTVRKISYELENGWGDVITGVTYLSVATVANQPAKASSIGEGSKYGDGLEVSDQKMYQQGQHYNKHGRDMGYGSKKSYEAGARNFIENNKSTAEIFEGTWNSGRGIQDGQLQIIMRANGKQVITQTSHIKNGICSLKNQYFSSQNSAQAAAEPHSNAFCMYFGSR